VFGLDAFYLGHFGRVPVYLRIDVLILAVLVFTIQAPLVNRLIYLGVILLTVLLHELGHAAVATARGMHGVRVVITGMGGFCTYSGLPDPGRELTISVAGPLMNFTLAGFAWLALEHLQLPNPLVYLAVYMFFKVNLYLGILNSLPIYPFDGGQALLSALKLRLSPRRAGGIVLTTSFVTAIIALGAATWWFGDIPWILVIFVFLSLFQASRDLR
jgi:membrane-associated protease RseP (regulator of RpoE activity)